jgi:hypothetical protein
MQMPNKVPPSVSAYFAKIGSKGGSSISPEKAAERARKGGLARAAKRGLGATKKAK